MLKRFSLLLAAGGWNSFLRTLLMLVTAAGIAIAEFMFFRETYSGVLVVLFVLLGWFFRKSFARLGTNYRRHSRRFLFVYGLLLFVAGYAGLGVQFQLAVIASACMVMFNLNFWSTTETAIVDQ